MSLTSDLTDIVFARPNIGSDEIGAVVRVLESGMIAQGPEVDAFETEFADAVGGLDAIAVSSGTAALEIALEALGIGPGHEVIVPAFTFIATAATVARAGATVRFADIDQYTFCLDLDSVERVVNPRTRLVIPVDLFGYPAPTTDIEAIVGPRVGVLEDAAQAHGARRGQQPVGGSGTATFSFYPTKNMTTAEGGMIVTDSPDLAERSRLIRNQGMSGTYAYETLGTNLRMTDVGAAMGRVQLGRLDAFVARRAEIAARYSCELIDLELPTEPAGGAHAWACYTIRHPRRDELQAHLADSGVATRIYYPEPLNRLPLFESDDRCPVSESASQTVLSLPIRPDLSDSELERVIGAVKAF